ncbi:hypothetical protein SERLA73DRAFT_175702 [Serpula lacrymans var. lacrymans S7.3]|uniref:CBS domain-containing protein n=2 Tax=Serpula lacrymans var. lacrymans TaxID=341189 RepID=F8PL83_SERL3|nr:uncharacterized protein SERLADRAFT_458268 [Serpula lacrymans var. lacrymans S7.9]EGO03991.1 hypothetical protein SERLA73DRAFT_175702 [Serpula lacrymans var. lacrymans S7.3]EGO29911.1 hypothetical protein SERLADRAFT_458268 [Serpula lacrymans var. lacrymans S7.9]
MSHSRRTSFSIVKTDSSPTLSPIIGVESEDWISAWKHVYARDLIDSRIVAVDAETSVEDACDTLLTEDIYCLAVRTPSTSPSNSPYMGLFDYSDVNAFLTLAATRHTISPEELRANPRVDQIVAAAKAGQVAVQLVSNLSEKNFLETLPYNADLIALLGVFSRGTHRVLIQCPAPSAGYLGTVSDRRLLSWFSAYANQTPSFQRYLSNPLSSLSLPSLNMYASVVATISTAYLLDAMKLMSEQGVSSVAVIDEGLGTLLSAVSVTDIGKIVVPSQSNHILSTPLHQFITQIKEPDGSMDGVDKYPVYMVMPSSTLSYTTQKLLATNAHRLFITNDRPPSPSSVSGSSGSPCGIVSIVDVLSLFARIANVPDVDPTHRQRRRASSSSSHSSLSAHDLARSRSSSRTSLRLSASPRIKPTGIPGDSHRNSISSLDSFQWAERVPKRE